METKLIIGYRLIEMPTIGDGMAKQYAGLKLYTDSYNTLIFGRELVYGEVQEQIHKLQKVVPSLLRLEAGVCKEGSIFSTDRKIKL